MNKDIRKKYIVSPGCQERFLPIDEEILASLREGGVAHSGVSSLVAPYRIWRKAYEHHQVFYTLEGKGWLKTPDGEFELGAGSVWLAPAGVAHEYGIVGEPWRAVWLALDDTAEWAPIRSGGTVVRASASGESIRSLVDCLLHELSESEFRSEHAVRLLSDLILLNLHREVDPEGGGEDDRFHSLLRLRDRVRRDPARQWSVESLLGEAGIYVCPAHFRRICMGLFGMPPMKMVQHLRIEEGAKLLTHTTHPLRMIAERVGYQTAFSFSAAFKKVHGCSPREYRRRSRHPGPQL